MRCAVWQVPDISTELQFAPIATGSSVVLTGPGGGDGPIVVGAWGGGGGRVCVALVRVESKDHTAGATRRVWLDGRSGLLVASRRSQVTSHRELSTQSGSIFNVGGAPKLVRLRQGRFRLPSQ